MPPKSQIVLRQAQRVARNPVESRSHEHATPNRPDEHSQHFHARISERAYELYEQYGREDGHALDHWLEAERQVINQDS